MAEEDKIVEITTAEQNKEDIPQRTLFLDPQSYIPKHQSGSQTDIKVHETLFIHMLCDLHQRFPSA